LLWREENRLVVRTGLVLLVLAAVTIAVVQRAERQPPPSFPPDSPEATVLAYLEALRSAERERVLALLSMDARRELERRERDPFFRFEDMLYMASQSLHESRIRLGSVERRADHATVTLLIERSSPQVDIGFPVPNVNGGPVSATRTLRLVREDGAWKIDELTFFF
jgi:hypothetical protein